MASQALKKLQDEEGRFIDSEGDDSEGEDDDNSGDKDANTAPPPYYLFAKTPDARPINTGGTASAKDNDVHDREQDGPWEDGSDDSSRDGGEDAIGARRKDEFPAPSWDGSPSCDAAFGNSTSQQLQDPFLSGALEAESSLVFPNAFISRMGATGAVGTKQTRAEAAGGAVRQGGDDIRPAGGGQHMSSR